MHEFQVFNELLSNGLKFIHINNPLTKAFEISLYVKSGSRDEKKLENGIAHFLEHMLFRGSKNYKTSFELSKKLESFGGEANATTSIDMTTIWLRGQQNMFKEALECFYEFVNFPNYADLELERSIVLEEMASDYNDTGVNIDLEYRSFNTLFPNSALGRSIIGTPNSCKLISKFQLEGFKNKFYTLDNIILAITSNDTHTNVLEHVNKIFNNQNNFSKKTSKQKRKPPNFDCTKEATVLCVPNQDNQFMGRLNFAFLPIESKQHVGMCCIQRYLDDGISSHLPATLRESLGLVYDISVDYTTYSDFNLFQVDFTVSEKNLESFLINFFKYFNLNDLDNSCLNHLVSRYIFDLETSQEHPSQILNREIFNLTSSPQMTFQHEIQYVNQIAISDLLNAWNILTTLSNISFVLIGPKAKKYNKILTHQINIWRATHGKRGI